jgi:hypothetical protein
MEQVTITRKELYDLVWAEPLSRLAWAEQKVSWYDPLVNEPDPLLSDHHKTHLFKEFLKEWQ